MPAASRPSTTEAGARGEDAVLAVLEARGYRILARNFRTRRGEIDLVALAPAGDLVCFVEVRARRAGSLVRPAETIDRPKRRRVVAAAQAFLAQWTGESAARFDVAEVTGGIVEYIEGAFDLDDA